MGVVDDLVWAPGISGIPSAEGRSLESRTGRLLSAGMKALPSPSENHVYPDVQI